MIKVKKSMATEKTTHSKVIICFFDCILGFNGMSYKMRKNGEVVLTIATNKK